MQTETTTKTATKTDLQNLKLEPQAITNISTDVIALAEQELREVITGEVRFDNKARSLYATDASPYDIKPYGVVIPKTIEDISKTVAVANEYSIPILPRGGGTSLAGQTVGEAIIIDVSKYLTKIIEFNEAESWVKVEPGVVRDQLNNYLKPYSLQFTPDISPTNRANVGGMIANNSSGTRSIKYGKSVDQVISMTVMLADGSIIELRDLTDAELELKKKQTDLEGQIYRTVDEITTRHREEIEARFPKVMRRVGGYNLDEFIGEQPFNLGRLVSGSEGTLAIILDVTVKLFPVPKHKILAMLHYKSLRDSMEAVQYINTHKPSAVETLDDGLFNLGKQNPNLAPLIDWVEGEPESVLLVEFDGETVEEMMHGLESMQADERIISVYYHCHMAKEAAEQAKILDFRRKGLGIYATIKGAQKPTAFIEDAAIPPENLADYIMDVRALCDGLGVPTVYYGHASVGVIHTRPMLDMKTEEGVTQYETISKETFKLVQKYGGSWSGEHGDGLIRSYQNKNLFGETLYNAFKEVKSAFDPKSIMNPGKIVDAQEVTENLRYGADYAKPHEPKKTHFDFSGDEGYLGAIEMCTGVGACRKVDTGVMCPSYMATRDEDHSTRGRANILRDAITGELPGGLTSQEVYDVLDLCLECKACKAECPSQVDMAKIKYEFLQHYYDEHGTPLSARVIALTAKVAPLGSLFSFFANALLPLKSVRMIVEKMAKVDKRRVLPAYTAQSFDKWFKKHETANSVDNSKRVALFADTWTMYNENNLGQSAVRVLEACGYAVELVPYGCCGRPQISKGLLREAKTIAEKNVDKLHAYIEAGIPVVGLEPSCIASFQDDYTDLVPGDKANAVAKHVLMIDQFLAKEWAKGEIKPDEVFEKSSEDIMLHGHCQQRSIMGTSSTKAVLGWISNVDEIDSGCCGMAGSFGYGHYDLSMQIGESRLFPAVREHEGETAACGFSCRHQIKDGTGKDTKHVVELLAQAIQLP